MRKSNYDKYPATKVEGTMLRGNEAISAQIKKDCAEGLCVVECYQGVNQAEIESLVKMLDAQDIINADELYKPL